MDIVLKVEETLVRYVVDVGVIAVAITHTHLTQTPIRHPIHREVVQVAEVVALQELQSHAGLERVRQFFIPLLKCRLSHPFDAP